MRILVIEDNQKLAKSLKRAIEQEGYAVDFCYDGLAGEKQMEISHRDYDLLILDLMLPLKDGIAICKTLRERKIMTPILMLTAKDTVSDRVLGLDSGADDYLVKPFALEELLSRIRALARRPHVVLKPELKVGELFLNVASQKVFMGKKELELTLKEFRILEYFMTRPNELITRQEIIDHLYDLSFNPFSRVMDMHVSNLRNKLHKQKYEIILETVRGTGYRLRG